jgi:serine/threonine-protein kinase
MVESPVPTESWTPATGPRRVPPPRPIFARAGAVVLGGLIALLVFNHLVMPRFVRHGREIEVPDATGVPLGEAVRRLQAAGLAVRDTLLRTSSTVPEGRVFDQTPRAGLHVKPERGVLLIVSQGKVEQRVPDLAGQTLRFARLALSQDGYELGNVVRVPSGTVPANAVVASDPPSGDVLPAGERIHLLVSDGPEKPRWILPDLAGRDLDETADRLNAAGFTAIIREEGFGWFFGGNRVHRTEPPAGTQVAEGDTVRLFGR